MTENSRFALSCNPQLIEKMDVDVEREGARETEGSLARCLGGNARTVDITDRYDRSRQVVVVLLIVYIFSTARDETDVSNPAGMLSAWTFQAQG